MLINALILIGAVSLASAVQMIAKSRLTALLGDPGDALLIQLGRLVQDPTLWLAGSLLLLAAFLWYLGLSRVPLSIAISFAALTYPLVMVGSHFFLKEPISTLQVLGCVFLLAGIYLIAGRGLEQ